MTLQPAQLCQDKYICDICHNEFNAPATTAHSQAVLVHGGKIIMLDFCPACTEKFIETNKPEAGK
jgi:hypothetical protein